MRNTKKILLKYHKIRFYSLTQFYHSTMSSNVIFFTHYNPFSSTVINFHWFYPLVPISSTVIHFHPFLSLSNIFINFIHFYQSSLISSIFSCPEQLIRWPCHSVTHSLTQGTFTFEMQRATQETWSWPDRIRNSCDVLEGNPIWWILSSLLFCECPD